MNRLALVASTCYRGQRTPTSKSILVLLWPPASLLAVWGHPTAEGMVEVACGLDM